MSEEAVLVAFKLIEDANESQFTILTKGKYFRRPRTNNCRLPKGKDTFSEVGIFIIKKNLTWRKKIDESLVHGESME